MQAGVVLLARDTSKANTSRKLLPVPRKNIGFRRERSGDSNRSLGPRQAERRRGPVSGEWGGSRFAMVSEVCLFVHFPVVSEAGNRCRKRQGKLRRGSCR